MRRCHTLALAGFLALLTVAAGSTAAQATDPPATAAAPASPARPFLWKASAGGHTIYLLGSIHVADESLYPLAPSIEAAFAASPVLVVEADLDAVDQGKLQSQILDKGMYPAEESLKASIPAELYAKVEQTLAPLGIPMSFADRMRPWMLALTVTALRLQQQGLKPELGIDLHLLKRARGGKEILELESADFQIRLLSGFSEKLQRLFLEQTLDDPLAAKEQIDRMIRFWRTGDAAGLEELLFAERRTQPELEPVFLQLFDQRNGSMADKIEGYLKAGKDCLVVVGAGHLVGDKGLVRLLAARGITVEQQ